MLELSLLRLEQIFFAAQSQYGSQTHTVDAHQLNQTDLCSRQPPLD